MHNTIQEEVTYKLVGDFLIKKESLGASSIFTAYKRVYGNPFRSKYKESKTYQGNLFGKVTSEKIVVANGVHSLSVNVALADLKQKIFNTAYKAIHNAYPETKDGKHEQGYIIVS